MATSLHNQAPVPSLDIVEMPYHQGNCTDRRNDLHAQGTGFGQDPSQLIGSIAIANLAGAEGPLPRSSRSSSDVDLQYSMHGLLDE